MPSKEQLLKELEIANKKNFITLKKIIEFTQSEVKADTISVDRLTVTIESIQKTALELLPKYQEKINPHITNLRNIIPNSISPCVFFPKVRNTWATPSSTFLSERKMSPEEQTLRERQEITNQESFITLKNLILSTMSIVETNKAEPNKIITEHLKTTVNNIQRTALEFTPEYKDKIHPLITSLQDVILYKESRPIPPTVTSPILSPAPAAITSSAKVLPQEGIFRPSQPLACSITSPSAVVSSTIPGRSH